MTTPLHSIPVAPKQNQACPPTDNASIADYERFFYTELRSLAERLDDKDSLLMEEEAVVRKGLAACRDPHQYLLLEQCLSDIAQERIQIGNRLESFEYGKLGRV